MVDRSLAKMPMTDTLFWSVNLISSPMEGNDQYTGAQ